MAVTIVRTPWVDDDGTGTTGTVLNNAVKQELYNQIDGALAALQAAGDVPIVQTSALTGTQNDFALTAGCSYLRLNNASLLTITGFSAGVNGQLLTVQAIGVAPVALLPSNVGSAALNRLLNLVTSGQTPLAPGGSATYRYDGGTGAWRLVQHAQGQYLTRTYNAANYGGGGAMTWTVEAGDIIAERFCLDGKTLRFNGQYQATSVGGTANPVLTVVLPNGYTLAATSYGQSRASDANSAYLLGMVIASGGAISLYKDLIGGSNWTVVTNGTHVYFTIDLELN